MENGPFIDDFPIKTSIYTGFSMAMLNNQRVYLIGGLEHGFLEYSPATNGTELPKKWYAYYFGTTISDWWFGRWLL